MPGSLGLLALQVAPSAAELSPAPGCGGVLEKWRHLGQSGVWQSSQLCVRQLTWAQGVLGWIRAEQLLCKVIFELLGLKLQHLILPPASVVVLWVCSQEFPNQIPFIWDRGRAELAPVLLGGLRGVDV